jgi:tetratricopeptide (TPR) repeat protein
MTRCDRATVRLSPPRFALRRAAPKRREGGKPDTTYEPRDRVTVPAQGRSEGCPLRDSGVGHALQGVPFSYVVSAFRRTVAAVISVVVLVSGCTSPQETATVSSNRPALRPVPLPDMTGAAEPVQAQLRERYASLTRRVESAGTAAIDLAAAYGEMGRLLIAAEYLDAAEPCFANAQALAPADMRWPYYLGHVYRFKNDPAKAAASFEQALTLQPDHAPSLVWLGEMHLAQNRPHAAEPLFARALTLQPRAAAARFGLGRVALARQDYEQAIGHLTAALELAPQASRIHYPLAMAYRGRGDRRNAEAHLRQRGDVEIPSADPLLDELGGQLQNAAAYEVRGSEAVGKREWADAIRNLRQAIELAPRNPGTRLNLGTALFVTGDAGGALEQFETAVRLAPESPKAHYSIGVIMEAAGRDQDAIDRFSAAVKYDPSYVEAQMQLADALRRNGRLDEALAHYAEVIKTSPAISQARFGYAMALVRLRRYQEARDSLEQGMNTYPDQPGFAHALARLLAAAPDDQVRDGRRARTLTETLLRQQKTMALAETMAMTLAESGEYDQAVTWQREAMTAAERAGQANLVQPMVATLRLYEARRPCRTPWRDDDPVFYPRPAR